MSASTVPGQPAQATPPVSGRPAPSAEGKPNGLLGYVCAKLGMRFPSSGGLITYLIEGFGKARLVGVACWLGYIAAIVIVGAMVAVSFGGYATALFVGEHAGGAWDNLFVTVQRELARDVLGTGAL